MPVLYLTHGGGPLPLLGEPSQADLTKFLQGIASRFEKPRSILIVSAHWETRYPTLTSSKNPQLFTTTTASRQSPTPFDIRHPVHPS